MFPHYAQSFTFLTARSILFSKRISTLPRQSTLSFACDFVLSVANLKQLPSDDKEEIAFAGRSNVGKSSLINALFGQRKLAKTSSTPGRTQQLNYFNLDDKIVNVTVTQKLNAL